MSEPGTLRTHLAAWAVCLALAPGALADAQLVPLDGSDPDVSPADFGYEIKTATTGLFRNFGGFRISIATLLSAAEKPTAPPDDRRQSLFKAIAENRLGVVADVLEAEPQLVSAEYEYGGTPLFWSAFYGHEDIAALFLKQGAKVDARGIQSATPLYEASYRGHPDTVKLLLEHDADINAANEDGHTPLYAAVSRGNDEVVEVLLKAGADPNGRPGEVGRLHGESLVMLAVTSATGSRFGRREKDDEVRECQRKYRRIAKALITHPKADLDHGLSAPLHETVRAGDVELTRLLLDHGADPNVRTGRPPTRSPRPYGFTPLHYAAAGGHSELMEILKRHGANPDIKNSLGQIPADLLRDQQKRRASEGKKTKPQAAQNDAKQEARGREQSPFSEEDAVRLLFRVERTRMDGTKPPTNWPEKIRRIGSAWIVDVDTSKLPSGYPAQFVLEMTFTGGHTGNPKRIEERKPAAGESSGRFGVGLRELTPGELVEAATRGESYPRQPCLSTEMRALAANEIKGSPEVRRAYEQLAAANRREGADLAAIADLEKQKALWCLLSCLASPRDDNQIAALRSLERLGDRRAVPFLLIYAEYMTVIEGGSENATIHGIIHQSIAKTLSTLTEVTVTLSGQAPEGLQRGIRKWRQWLVQYESAQGEGIKAESPASWPCGSPADCDVRPD